jgi:TPR repeat protein
MLQPKPETSVQKTDIPSPPPPPAEPPRAETPPAPVAPAPTISAEENRRLLAKAASMIQQGDIASARLVLDRLTRFGDARAAFALAETFDPKMLAQWNVRGIRPDPTRAKTYYTQAARAGIGEARDRLSELGD